MTRLLEILVAIVLVVVLAIVAGVLMPGHGHVERSVTISHNIDHTYDVLNNFRRFPDYSALRAYDPGTEFTLSGPAYGVGAQISWHGNSDRVGDGSLEILSDDPENRQIVWGLTNDWRGHDKKFTIDIDRNSNEKLVDINMMYDVDYGWNLVDRYSQLYLHGDPASFIQYSLADLQSLLANVPNSSYDELHPRLVDTPQQPVLLVSTQAPRGLADVAAATTIAVEQIDAAMKRLGVSQTGPAVTITTDWGDQNYVFDVAVPIDSSVLTIDGKSVDLHDAPQAKSLAEQNIEYNLGISSEDEPAAASSTGGEEQPDDVGKFESDGTLLIDAHVRAALMFGGRALSARIDDQSPAYLPLVRDQLKAYAGTHGYTFNEYSERLYDVVVSGDDDTDPMASQSFIVYLPVSDAPATTPDQTDDEVEAQSPALNDTASGEDVMEPAGSASSETTNDAGDEPL